jgi:hypothetical protein
VSGALAPPGVNAAQQPASRPPDVDSRAGRRARIAGVVDL